MLCVRQGRVVYKKGIFKVKYIYFLILCMLKVWTCSPFKKFRELGLPHSRTHTFMCEERVEAGKEHQFVKLVTNQ